MARFRRRSLACPAHHRPRFSAASRARGCADADTTAGSSRAVAPVVTEERSLRDRPTAREITTRKSVRRPSRWPSPRASRPPVPRTRRWHCKRQRLAQEGGCNRGPAARNAPTTGASRLLSDTGYGRADAGRRAWGVVRLRNGSATAGRRPPPLAHPPWSRFSLGLWILRPQCGSEVLHRGQSVRVLVPE